MDTPQQKPPQQKPPQQKPPQQKPQTTKATNKEECKHDRYDNV